MSRFWSSLTHDLRPYVPGEQPRMADLVKLNTNENPFAPSPRALEAIRGEAADTLRLYPDPQASALRAALAAYHHVRPEQVFVGNGSDEVLAHTFAALLKHDAPLLFPDITYSFYPVYCRLFGIEYEAVPLDQAMQIRVADYRRLAGGLIVPNPNAPTGIALSRAEIATLLEQHPDAPVVIDEAYVDFGAETAIPLVASHQNLLVVQTMSKSRALAGLRVGYAIGDADLIEALTRVKDSFNSYPLGRPAQAGAIASLQDEGHFQQSRLRVIEGRERLTLGLQRLGFDVLPSSANFVFARHPAHEGAALAAALRQRAVIVRHFSAPRISDYLRITVGTDEQIDRLLSALSRSSAASLRRPDGAGSLLVDAYHPSSTILPRDLPLSSSACARLRLAALMAPKVWSSVVRNTPLSMRSATSLSSMCWPIMSGVWNDERVNIDSQWIEIALPLKALTVNSGGSSIRPNLPCGAIKSAIAL